MTKIMLVEDDNNLREIYEARLLAEGYEIVSAKDGEEALALAVKEKPDLIISDVMMPKISGFDMLDILRSTPETKNTKVIMMTALSQAEDKSRADKLGADRYLVKSQVTLEDVAKVAHEVLTGEVATPAAEAPAVDTTPVTAPASPAPMTDPTPAVATPADTPVPVAPPAADPASVPSDPMPLDNPSPAESAELAPAAAEESAAIEAQINNFVENVPSTEPAPQPATDVPAPAPEPVTNGALPPTATQNIEVQSAPEQVAENPGAKANELAEAVNKIVEEASPTNSETSSDSPSTHKRVITPINDPAAAPDLNQLLAQEEARATANDALPTPPVDTVVDPGSTPPAPDDTPAETHEPGKVIAPSEGDPGNVAL